MGNPKYGDIHVDEMLTNMSVAYIQDESAFIAGRVFPIIPVKRQSDRYFTYLKEDAFRDEAAERVYGAESKGGGYDVDNTPTYFCKIYAYHKDVFPTDRANSNDPLMPDIDAAEYVTQKLMLKREVDFNTRFLASGIWLTEYDGAAAAGATDRVFWNKTTSTPLEDIGNAQVAVQAITSKKPNTLVIGPYVYMALRNNTEVRDLLRYTMGPRVPTTELLAQIFDVERVLVGNAVRNVAAKGDDEDTDFILGKHALLCYTENAPGIKKVSAGYIFAWTGLEGAGAFGNRLYRIPMDLLGLGTIRIEGEMAYTTEVVSTSLGVFFNDIVE